MSTSPHRRRWFQISLRTLLILVTVTACGFGWLGLTIRQAQQRKEAVETLRNMRWEVRYDYELTKDGRPIKLPRPPGPVWLREMFGLEFVANVIGAYNLQPSGTDADLVQIRKFTQLRYLGIHDMDITDAGLGHLEGLTQLEALRLSSTNVSNAGLAHLRRLTRLRHLDLAHTRITDVGLANVRELIQLESLNLNDTRVTNAGLVHLQGITGLEDLYLEDTQVTDAGAQELQKALPKVRIYR
jgi:hypothetical protein